MSLLLLGTSQIIKKETLQEIGVSWSEWNGKGVSRWNVVGAQGSILKVQSMSGFPHVSLFLPF